MFKFNFSTCVQPNRFFEVFIGISKDVLPFVNCGWPLCGRHSVPQFTHASKLNASTRTESSDHEPLSTTLYSISAGTHPSHPGAGTHTHGLVYNKKVRMWMGAQEVLQRCRLEKAERGVCREVIRYQHGSHSNKFHLMWGPGYKPW